MIHAAGDLGILIDYGDKPAGVGAATQGGLV